VYHLINQTITNVLKKISQMLQGHDVEWLVVGTASLAVQGVNLQPGDIDIITTKDDVFKIAEILKQYETKQVEFGRTPLFESYMGVYEIDGIKVEIMGDLREKRGNEWVSLTERLMSPIIIEIDGTPIPVSSLKDQIVSYEKLGRPKDSERVAKIRKILGQ
jgi:predicted nucleotidyltransferase